MYIQVITLGSQELIEQKFYEPFFYRTEDSLELCLCTVCAYVCTHTQVSVCTQEHVCIWGEAVSDGLPFLVTLHVP